MKRVKTLLLALLSISAFSQSFWNIVDDNQYHNKSSFTDNSLLDDSLIIVGGYVDVSCSSHSLSAYDLDGKLAWSGGGYCDVICTKNNSIYTAGFTFVDDVAGQEQVIITKYDYSGNVMFQSGFPELPNYSYDWFSLNPNSIDASKNGNVIVSFINKIIKTSSNGSIILEKDIDLQEEIMSAQFINNNSLLLTTTNTLYKSDSSCNFLDSILYTNNIVESLIHNDTIYCLFDNSLIVLDTNLNYVDTLINSNDIEFVELKRNKNGIWINGIKNNLIQVIHLKNSLIFDTLSYDLMVNSPSFLVSDSTIIFSGNSYSGQIATYSYHLRIKEQQVSLPNIDFVDFGISNIEIIYGGWDNTVPVGYSFETEMTIKNNGNDTITSFAVYSIFHGGYNCVRDFFYKKYTNVLILPNQELTFEVSRLSEYGMNNNQICFECLAPNSQIETNIINNKKCKTFSITGISEIFESNKYHIYPNPTKDFITIECPKKGFKSIRLYDMSGVVLFDIKNNDSNITIDLNKFTSGIFLITIISENDIYTQKIIKE